MTEADIPEVVDLQRACVPDPFPEDLLWNSNHLKGHLWLFPAGQFVAKLDSAIIASASNTLISENRWQAHESWEETVGGPCLGTFDSSGSTLYGLDISVHP